MIKYLQKHFLVFARSLETVELVEDFVISAVTTIIGVRLFLNLTNFPQLGAGGIHISHMLWGGLLMLVSISLSLAFLNKEARRLSSFVGGVGFGLFIDEMGKFVTSDNDYFFNPTFALIYMVFVLFLISFRSLVRRSALTRKEYAINALEVMKEIVFDDLDREEKNKALLYLSKSDPKNSIVIALRSALLKYDNTPPANYSRILLLRRKLKDELYGLARRKNVAHAIVVFFILTSLVRIILSISTMEWGLTFWEWGRQSSSFLVFAFVAIGLYKQRRGLAKSAYRNYLNASIASILLVQFFDFYHDQLMALVYLIINIVIYLTLHFIVQNYPSKGNRRSTS